MNVSRPGWVVAVAILAVACGAPERADESPAVDSTGNAAGLPSTTITDGDVCEFKCPEAGSVMTVSFVRFDEELALFASPAMAEAVGAAAPASDVVATGDNRWGGIEVTADAVTGWAWSGSLNWESPLQSNITDRLIADLGGVPSAPTLLELGQIVADSVVGDPSGESRGAIPAVVPTEGTVRTAVFDVDQLDDSGDTRVWVTGRQTLPATGLRQVAPGFELVEATAAGLCNRGLTTDGLCV